VASLGSQVRKSLFEGRMQDVVGREREPAIRVPARHDQPVQHFTLCSFSHVSLRSRCSIREHCKAVAIATSWRTRRIPCVGAVATRAAGNFSSVLRNSSGARTRGVVSADRAAEADSQQRGHQHRALGLVEEDRDRKR
jgi:hypothetical protein